MEDAGEISRGLYDISIMDRSDDPSQLYPLVRGSIACNHD
jgi:hypothetical protein